MGEKGEAGAEWGSGYCSVPGLPRLQAEGRGMIVFHFRGRQFFVCGVLYAALSGLCVATPL